MAKWAALLDGFVAGADTRRRWDDAAQRRKDDAEDRVWTREERARSVEDRARRQKNEDEDRARRRQLEDIRLDWDKQDRARRAELDRRTDAEYAEEQGDKKVFADAYQKAEDARATDAQMADLRRARIATGLGVLPPESAPDTYVIPGSTLERMADDAQRPARPAAPAGAGPQPVTTADDTVIPGYEGALPTPTMDAPPPAAPAAAAAQPAAARRSFLQAMNPFGAAEAATVPATAPPPGPPGPQAVESPRLGIRDMLMREPEPNPPAVPDAAPAAPPAAVVAPIPAPRRTAPDPAPQQPQVLPETSAGGQPPDAASTVPASPPGTRRPSGEVQGGIRDVMMGGNPAAPQATPAQPSPEVKAPAAVQIAEAQGLGNIGAMRAGVDPRALPPSGPGRAPSGPATPSQEIAEQTLLGPRQPRAAAREGLGLGREPVTDDTDAHVSDFMTYYQKEAVPEIVEHYLKSGRPDAAATFQSWAQDQATKAGMAAWARGVRAASAGNEKGFLDNMIEAYNSDGYFDDGFEIVRKGSGFKRDDDGNITGATLVFKDQQTGKSFSRDFDNADIYTMGVDFLSPEKVFDYGMSQIDAAAKAQQEEVKHQRQLEIETAKAAARAQQTPQARVAAAAKALADDPTFSQLPPEEKSKKILEQIQMEDAAAAALAGQAARPAARTGVPMWTGDE